MITAILIIVIVNLVLTIIHWVDVGVSIEEVKFILGIKGTRIEKDLHKKTPN